MLQPFKTLEPAAFVDQIAGKAGGRDDQADHGDRDSHRFEDIGIGAGGDEGEWRHRHCRHRREMQADDCQYQKPDAEIVRPAIRPARRLAYRRGGECHRDQQRSDDIEGVPFDDASHVVGHHAGIMHGRDRQPDDASAPFRRQTAAFVQGKAEARPGSNHGDDQRDHGECRIEGDRRAGLIGQHGDEMRAPDRGTSGDSGQEQPSPHLHAGGFPGAVEETDRHPAAGDAHQRRQQDEPQIMLRDDA